MKLICFILLSFVQWVIFAQSQLPYNISDYARNVPVDVSPCGVAVVRFQVNQSAQPNYFFTMTFTAITPVPFRFSISLKAPNGPTLDFAQCQPLFTCTTSPCSLIQGCGDQSALWYAYVETVGLDQGRFSMDLTTTIYPPQVPLSIDNDNFVQNLTRFGGSPLGAGGSTLSQFDFYTFTLSSRPAGTVMNIEIKPESGTMNTVLYRGSTNANQFAQCVTGTLNRTRLEACEVAAGGPWSLAIERTQGSQFYLLRLWYDDAINYQLTENIGKAAALRAVNDVVYFKYDIPVALLSTAPNVKRQQIFFVLDNVVGGVVEIQAIYNQPPGSQCAGGITCSSIEGCHLTIEQCQINLQGYYTIVAKALAVFQPYIQVSFEVRGYLRSVDLTPNTFPAGQNVRSSIRLSEYDSFRFTQPPTLNIGDWMDIELYVDRDLLDDVPATMFIGTKPFPQNFTYQCSNDFYRRCDTDIWMGNQRWCFIQLDPCELELFTTGVYVSVWSNNQINRVSRLQEHTFFQNPMDFTIYTSIRNPNKFLINHGTVITDEVTETWKKAYKIDDTIRSGALEIAISANYHYVFDQFQPIVTDNDTSRVEIDVDVVYAQTPYIGPKCLTCYRVQQTFSVSLRALDTIKFVVNKCVQGNEHIYLVITGNNTRSLINRTQFNFTDNRYVITAKNIPILSSEIIKPTQFSNIISQANAFGGLQYWLLDFNRELLRNCTMTLKLRAHPRSGRQMTLFIADGFDPNCAPANRLPRCGSTIPGLSYNCGVNNTNKGFCYINIQPCVLIPHMNRTFYVEVKSFNRPNLTLPDVEVEYAYSFTYDLIPSIPRNVPLGQNTQIIVDVEAELYSHFAVQIPPGAVGRDTLIFEAYFDSNNLYASLRPITLYVNAPSGKTLAGRPTHSAQCLCFTYQVSDLNKVVLVIDRCDLEAGTWFFSVYTDSFGFKEGQSHVTIKVYTIPYVIPIAFEDLNDFSLFLRQSAAYQITLDGNMLTDNGRTDKELQVWVWSNINQYNASIQIRLTNNIGTCGCGQAFTDVSYSCGIIEDSRSTQVGRCDIIGGPCNFSPGNWFIITTVTQPDPLKPVDIHQVVPFTLTASKANAITTVQTIPLVTSSTCDFVSRRPAIISNVVRTEEWKYFNVQGQPSGFSIYVDNVTFGSLTIYAGNNLPTINCSISSVFCPETPNGGGPPCIYTFVGCSSINYIGIKVVSNIKNTDVRFQISSCIRNVTAIPVATLNFGNLNGTSVVIQNNGAQPITFGIPQLQTGQSPYVIISIRGSDNFRASIARGACTSCNLFTANCTNVGVNCTMYIPFCDLPNDYQTGNWTLTISNLGAGTTFTAVAFAVNNNIGNLALNSNQQSSFVIQPLSWTNVAWTLTAADLVPYGTGTQSSSIAFSGGAASLLRFINDGTGLTCLSPFTVNSFQFSQCCTVPGVKIYSFFNLDFLSTASISVTPTLTTNSQNHTSYVWSVGTPSVQQNFVAGGIVNGNSILVEYVTTAIGVAQYGTLIFQASVPSGVNIYLQRNFLAGPLPPAKGGCFTNEFTPTPTNGVATQTIFACVGSTNPLSLVSLDTYFPQTIYVGFENTQAVTQTGTFNFSYVAPIQLLNATQSQIVSTGVNTVNQQFFYQPSANAAYIQRRYRFNVTVFTGTVQMFINRKTAAGPSGGCQANIISGATTNTNSILSLETCPNNNDLFFVGIVTSSDRSSYVVTVTEVNLLYETTPPEVIFPSIPFFKLSPGSTNNYDVTFQSIPPNSYLRVSVDNITLGSTYTITVYRDGTCQPFENTFCGEKTNFGQKCTTVVSGCQLQAGILMHIVIAGNAGSSYVLLAEIITFSANPSGNQIRIQSIPTPPGNPGELLFTKSTSTIIPHDLALFQVTIPPSSVLPGENIRILIDSIDCGGIDMWGYVGGPPGPFCSSPDVICSGVNCVITSLRQCDTFRASTAAANWATDIYVLVRGKAHSEGNVAVRFGFKVERFGSYDVRSFYYLEKHQILPVRPTPLSGQPAATCPASRVPAPFACCPGGGGAGNAWIWQPTVFHFPVEGHRYLNEPYYQRLKISIDNTISPYVRQATLRVWNQHPSFCPQDFPNRISVPGEFTRCSVNQSFPNCTVNLQIPVCGLVDSHLLFFTVEDIQFNGLALPATVGEFGEGVTLSHTRIPNVIIPIYFKATPQYFEGDLLPGQIQYFKVFHNNVNQPNYHFNVQILRVTFGTIALNHRWSECPTNQVCQCTNCRDIDPRDPNSNDCKVEPDCDCNYEHIQCRGGDMNLPQVGPREGFFTIKGINVTGGLDAVHYVILVEFQEILEPIGNIVCGNETCEEERYYDRIPAAGPEELYRFRLASVNGKSNILIAHDTYIGLDGYINPVQGGSCQKTRLCDSLVNGLLDECVTFYRTPADLTPYASVHTTAACVDHKRTRFNLNHDKLTPPIAVLTDGVRTDSQVVQTQAGCNVFNQTYWYKITTNKGQYMVVELWGISGENMQLWVQKNHITFNQYGEDPSRGCTTGASAQGLYCRYIIACGYTPGLYYIQVSDSNPLPKLHPYFRHHIRVTTMDPIDLSINMGQDIRFDLLDDLRQIQTVTITNVAGNEEQPWKDMIAYTFSQIPVDSWMTRNRFGDASCSVSFYFGKANSNAHSVAECQVDNAGGVFKVHFIGSPAGGCFNSRSIAVSTRFNQPGAPVGFTNPPNQGVGMLIRPGSRIWIKHTVSPLTANDIVYSRLSNFDTQTRLTTTIWKGNHLNTDRATYALPCSPGCAQGPLEASSHLAWADVCFHCGSSLYDTIFVQVDARAYTGNTSLINTVPFTSTLTVTQAIALTSTPRNENFPREEPSLKFYTADNMRDRGSRIELNIAKAGAIGVEVNVYSQACGYRTPPSQYWCFPGHVCSIPVPENHNFGDFYANTGQDSPYLSQKHLIVVRAIDAAYTILQVQGSASCNLITAATAPFCAPLGSVVTSRPMWGNTNTFREKDRNALEFFYNLTRDFSCKDGSDHCDCEFLSQPCRTNLAIYACLSMFNPCNSDGLELQPNNQDCTAVESTCPKTFRCAGYPERSCGASFYFVPPQPTRAPTGANATPTAPTVKAPTANATKAPTKPTTKPSAPTPGTQPTPGGTPFPTETPTDTGAIAAFPGWIPGVVIFLIVLVAILLVTTIAGAVLMCTGGAGSPNEVDAYQAL